MIPGDPIPLNKWQQVTITITGNKVKVVFNGVTIIDEYQDNNILTEKGYIAMGVNFSPVKFTDIQMTA